MKILTKKTIIRIATSVIVTILAVIITLIIVGQCTDNWFVNKTLKIKRIPEINKEIAIFNTNPFTDKRETFISVIMINDKLVSDILNKSSNDKAGINDSSSHENFNNKNINNDENEIIFNFPLPLNISELSTSLETNLLSKTGLYLSAFVSKPTLTAFKEFLDSVTLFLKTNTSKALIIVKINSDNLLLNEFVLEKGNVEKRKTTVIKLPEGMPMQCMKYLINEVVN